MCQDTERLCSCKQLEALCQGHCLRIRKLYSCPAGALVLWKGILGNMEQTGLAECSLYARPCAGFSAGFSAGCCPIILTVPGMQFRIASGHTATGIELFLRSRISATNLHSHSVWPFPCSALRCDWPKVDQGRCCFLLFSSSLWTVP